MNSYKKLDEVLQDVQKHLMNCRASIENARRAPQSEHSRAVLETLRDDEFAISAALKSYSKKGGKGTNAWIQFIPDEEVKRIGKEMKQPEAWDGEEITTLKAEFDGALADMFEHMAGRVSASEAQELLEQLGKRFRRQAEEAGWDQREPDQG